VSRAERLFGLAQFLASKSGRTLSEIAERFDVSERTVFRDLAALQDQGVPIVFAEGRYRILDSHPSAVSLDSGELVLVRLALANPALARKRTLVSRGLQSLLAKLDSALREREARQK
jgi:predicted DNA-binding transcriptional regulator YafY